MYKTIAFTGHRPKDLDSRFGYDYTSPGWRCVIDTIKNAIKYYKTERVIVGGAQGLDTAAALAALELKSGGYPITIQLEVPFLGQEREWSSDAQVLYKYILEHADKRRILSNTYTGKYLYQGRNESMVNQSDLVITLWNGKTNGGTYNTLSYANKQGKPCINIYKRVMTLLDVVKKSV